MQKLIITVALTGNVPTKKLNPNLPLTPDEIAEDVLRCSEAGAVLFHIHARDVRQKPTLNTAVYIETVHKIKKSSPEVIIQLSTQLCTRSARLNARHSKEPAFFIRKYTAWIHMVC